LAFELAQLVFGGLRQANAIDGRFHSYASKITIFYSTTFGRSTCDRLLPSSPYYSIYRAERSDASYEF